MAQGLGQFLQLATMALILFVLAAALDLPKETMVSYVLATTFLSMPMQNFMHRIPDLLRGDVALAKIRAMNLSIDAVHNNEETLPYTDRPSVGAVRSNCATSATTTGVGPACAAADSRAGQAGRERDAPEARRTPAAPIGQLWIPARASGSGFRAGAGDVHHRR